MKPRITWKAKHKMFYRDEEPIGVPVARRHWDAADADWTSGAYGKMAKMVMAKNEQPSTDH